MRQMRRIAAQMVQAVRIREVERLAAEIALQDAELERQATARRLEAVRLECTAREEDWLQAVSRAHFDLELTNALAGAVNDAHTASVIQEGVVEASEARRRVAAEQLQLAQGRLDAAAKVANEGRRRAWKRAEERRLADGADRIAGVWWGA